MVTLVIRHLKLYLKKPTNIILSFLSSGVILSLYFLFIREFTIKAVSDYGFNSQYNELFVDRLMTSGLLIVIGATSVLSIMFIFVKDRYSGLIKDFLVTPISDWKILYSYFFASFFDIPFGIELFFLIHYQDQRTVYQMIASIFTIFCSNMIASLIILIIDYSFIILHRFLLSKHYMGL